MILLQLFCHVDDFCLVFEEPWQQQLIESGKKKRKTTSRLSLSEVMTIVIWFHQSGFRHFKAFYQHIQKHYSEEFPNLVSYNRFIELKQSALIPLSVYLKTRFGRSTGVAFIDSTKITVCHNKRIKRNRVFEGPEFDISLSQQS